MGQLFVNNLTLTLSEDVVTNQPTLSVVSSTGLPTFQLGDWLYLTLTDIREGGELRWEIVKVTSWTGTTLTVVRGQDGTAAQAWLAGAKASLRVTAADMTELEAAVTPAQLLTAIKTVDGSDSGLDADMLDGLQGSYYQNASNINAGTLAVARGGTGTSTLTGLVKGNGTSAMTAAVAGTDYVIPSGSITGNAATATTLQTARTINGVSFNGSANITIADSTKIPTAEKGVANGVATLGSDGKVPSTQLPSYVDDVLEFTNLASFPATGESGKIYVALDTNKTYRWSGSAYVYITSGAVDSVAGKTGVVTLVKADVGLSNVDNTSDANKPVSTATQTALNTKLDSASYTASDVLAKIKTVDGAGSGLDADLLDGVHINGILPYHSGSDFTDGTLVVTDIPSGNAESFVLELTGKSYSSNAPFSLLAQGYLYDSTITNTSAVDLSGHGGITTIKMLDYNGFLSFWWPRIGYWHSFQVHVRSAGGSSINRVVNILNSVEPDSSKKISVPVIKSWTSHNDGSGSGLDADLLDGRDSSDFATARNRNNWNDNTVINQVSGQLSWKNYGNGHTIFDASNSTSPDGTSVNSADPQAPWNPTFPTLMGWNGAGTYGVRVDSARNADLLDGVDSSGFVKKDEYDVNLFRLNARGTGNAYDGAGVELLGSGTDNIVKPALGFNQPDLFSGTLEQIDAYNFQFKRQDGAPATLLNTVSNAETATKLATARTINGVAFDGTADIVALPARLASGAQFISDWNFAVENGWYQGYNLLNAPNADWNLGIVEAHDSNWVTQTVHSFTSDSSSNSQVWRRQRNGVGWGNWYKLQLTQEEQDARYIQSTGDQTIAGVKTFSSSPVVPAATNATQAVNLGQFIGTNVSLSANGYQKLPSGLIIQWGFAALGSNLGGIHGTHLVGSFTFPIAFPNYCASISLVTNVAGSSAGEAVENTVGVQSASLTACDVYALRHVGSGSVGEVLGVNYIAIGY